MNPKRCIPIILLSLTVALIAACGESASSPTPTPDPCAEENLTGEVQKVNDLLREFDDAAALAANTPREQLMEPITNLQRIRRVAEDQRVPDCLATLKGIQLSYMNAVIQTMLGFVSSANQQAVNEGIAVSRKLHNDYLVEMARLLGMTVVALPTPTALPPSTPTP